MLERRRMNFIWSSFLNGKLIKRWNEEKGGEESKVSPGSELPFTFLRKFPPLKLSFSVLIRYLLFISNENIWFIILLQVYERRDGVEGKQVSWKQNHIISKIDPTFPSDARAFCSGKENCIFYHLHERLRDNRMEGSCAKTILIRSAEVGCNFVLPLCYQSTKCVDWFYWV